MDLKKLLLCCCVLLMGHTLFGQKVDVRGFIYDKVNGQPLPGITVVLTGTSLGAVSDINGFFNISNVPKGTYTLRCSSLIYDTVKLTITVINEIVNKKIVMSRSTRLIKEFVVNGTKEEKKTQTTISLTKITSKEIKALPSVGGVHDLAQYLQVLPGVVSTGDQGGELYIRGGTPVMNKMLLDGITIYNPFHSIGLFSIFETEIIKTVNVQTGAFNAQYGGRIGAVVDVQTRDGNKKELSGVVGVNPFQSKLILEGPIKKFSEESGGSSFIFSAKTSYLDQTSKVLYPYADKKGLPYSYDDLYGKINLSTNNGSHMNLFGFYSDDNANYLHISDYKWTQYGLGTNFTILPPSSRSIINGSLSYSNYNLSLQESNLKPRTTGISGLDFDVDFTYYIPHGSVKYGINLGTSATSLNFFNTQGLVFDIGQNTTELSGFLVFNKTLGRLVIEPSLRLHYYASPGVASPEPRVSAKYVLGENIRLKAAWGIYSQNILSTKSDLDIVNLFTGFLTAPNDELKDIHNMVANNNIQKAIHYVAGVEYDPFPHAEMTFEGYYKDFNRIVNINREKQLPTDPDFALEIGKAYGADFLFKYDYKNYFFWVTYSLGYVTRTDSSQTYYAHYDRRHNINILGSYVFGKKKDWQFDARWNYGSGLPFTLTQGYFPNVDFTNGIGTNYTTANESLGVLYSNKINNGRLPAYHRLDISLKKTIKFSEKRNMELIASVINLYNQKNVFYVDRTTHNIIYQLPIIPAIGVNVTF